MGSQGDPGIFGGWDKSLSWRRMVMGGDLWDILEKGGGRAAVAAVLLQIDE